MINYSITCTTILIFFCLPLLSQDTISTAYVKNHSYEFQLSKNGVVGNGGEFLKDEFSKSQFVLIGEHHGQARISEFTAAVLPELAHEGFNYFCIETGAHSTEILKEFSSGHNLPSQLSKFYTEYYQQVKDIPIPFLEGKEDVEFLQAAIDNEFVLFGIDQEYYSSTLMLVNRLLTVDLNEQTQKLHNIAASYIIEQQLKAEEEDNFSMHREFIKSSELKEFFNSLDKSNDEINQIIQDLKLSWHIYELYSSNLNQNLELRAAYMKRQFASNYRSFSKKDSLPKILIKMGAFHTMRGITYNAVYDIGNLVSEFADFNGTHDLNIGFLFRYIEDDEEPEGFFDNSIGSSDWLKQRQPILLQGQKENWVAIDLRSMKDDIINRKIWCYPDIKKMMYDLDIVIIPPMAKEITLNYEAD